MGPRPRVSAARFFSRFEIQDVLLRLNLLFFWFFHLKMGPRPRASAALSSVVKIWRPIQFGIWRAFGGFLNSLQSFLSCPRQKKNTPNESEIFKLGPSLERVWRISKLTPNSFIFFDKNVEKEKTQKNRNVWVWTEFGVSLERVWRISKLTPNSGFFPTKKKK